MTHITDLVVSMSTGVPPLDQLLPSGLLTGEIVELSGCSRIGKTQMCVQMAAFVAAQPHSIRNHVIYIDTAGAMDPSRLIALLKANGCTPDQLESALRKIVVFRALNSFSLLSILDHVDQNMSNSVRCSLVFA
jgi:RecA/RadA recombinase